MNFQIREKGTKNEIEEREMGKKKGEERNIVPIASEIIGGDYAGYVVS